MPYINVSTSVKVNDKRKLLEEISFMPFLGHKSYFQIEVDKTENPVNIKPLDININFNTEK